MRNTTHKLFKDKTLRHLHDDLNICGVVRNHFIALSMRYYRRYDKGLSYAKMSKHLTKLKKLEKYQHWNIPYAWSSVLDCNPSSTSVTQRGGHKPFAEGYLNSTRCSA